MSTAASMQAETTVSQQLIVKFKPSTVACNAQAIARFSIEAKVHLEFLRPMSGDACVVVHKAASVSGLVQQQRTLKQHPFVEWAEADAMMQTH